MQAVRRNVRLLWDALFLQRHAYEELRDDDNPFVEGLFILVLVGLLIAAVAIVGSSLEWGSSPNPADIQDTVLRNLRQMPWWDQMEQEGGQEALDIFQRIWDTNWSFVQALLPTPAKSLAGIVTRPVGLIVGWLVFGVLAHALARLFGGSATLNQTLGTTALAVAPQILTAVAALPFVVAAGVGTWTLVCRYMALRTAHDLSWPRAMWATLLPPIILAVVIGVLLSLGLAVFGAGLAAFFAGGQ